MNYEVENFDIDIIEASYKQPVMVDFWAEWCAPCRMLGPVMEKLAIEFDGKIKLVKVDTEQNREPAAKYGIRSIPNVKLFVNGEVKDEFTGALPEGKVREWIIKNLPESGELKTAKEFIAAGKDSEAIEILEKFILKEEGNAEGQLLLAKLYLFSDAGRTAELLSKVDPGKEQQEMFDALQLLSAMIPLAGEAPGLPEGTSRSRFKTSLENLKGRDFSEALENLIEIIREDRYYFDDAARKVCIAIFKYLGEENPVTLEYRRDFSRALY